MAGALAKVPIFKELKDYEKCYNCRECDEFGRCEKLKLLEQHHGKAHLKNLRKIKNKGPKLSSQERDSGMRLSSERAPIISQGRGSPGVNSFNLLLINDD